MRSSLGATDFAVFYAAGESVRSIDESSPSDMFVNKKQFRKTIQKYRELSSGGTKFLYLPPAALFFAPLTILPYPIALKAWAVLIALCFVAAYYGSIRFLLEDAQLTAPKYSVLLLLLAFSTSASRLIQTGQVNSIVWLLLVLFFFGLIRERPWIAGLSLSIAIPLKVFPVLFAPLLLIHKQWKALWITIGCSILLMIAGLGFIGTDNIAPYVQDTLIDDILLSKASTEGSTIAANAWRSVKAFDLSPRKTYRSIIEHGSTAATLLSLLATYCLIWKKRNTTPALFAYTPFILIILLLPLFTHTEWLLWLIPLCVWGVTRQKNWIKFLSIVMIALTQFWLYTERLLSWQPVIKTMTIGILIGVVVWWVTLVQEKN
jgi:hypothetical protein